MSTISSKINDNNDDDDNEFTITPPLSDCEKLLNFNDKINQNSSCNNLEQIDISITNNDDDDNNTNDNNNNKNNGIVQNFNHWIYCIIVVNFDIEIGQSIECIYPKNVHLTEKEMSNICYLSFPDSNSGCMGDTQFYFRTKCCPLKNNELRMRYEYYFDEFNSKCLSLLQVDKSYLHGFVYFRQVKDRNLKRGYFQKSLVILTWLPFVSLFQRIMKILSPKYFEFGLPSLEAACGDMNRWSKPKFDQILHLPLFGTVTNVIIPGERHSSSMCQTMMMSSSSSPSSSASSIPTNGQSTNRKYSSFSIDHHQSSGHQSLLMRTLSISKLTKKSRHNNYNNNEQLPSSSSSTTQSSTSTSNIKEPLSSPSSPTMMPSMNQSALNVANDVNIYRNLLPVITHIQLLWELVLTNEPIAVIAQTPNVCSQIVNALIALIAPLRYGADYRPFFTIHDSEFKEYTAHTKSLPPVILGVTNPFFVKTLQDWPHLIKINELSNSNDFNNSDDQQQQQQPELNSDDKQRDNGIKHNHSNKKHINNHHHNNNNQHHTIKKLTHTIDQVLKLNNSKSLELKTGVYTKYKPFLQKDRDILKKLLKGIDTNRPLEVQNAMLRRFLIELTQSFLIPLERYFASLMPLAKNLSPFKRPPILQHFKIDEFIKSLNATGPHLTSLVKGDWTGLYRRFLRSPNFVCWYSNRLDKATHKIQTLHLEKICDSNLVNQLNDKQEVEIVDLILKLKDNLNCVTSNQFIINNNNNNNLNIDNYNSDNSNSNNNDRDLSLEFREKLQKNLDKIIEKLPEDSRSLFIK